MEEILKEGVLASSVVIADHYCHLCEDVPPHSHGIVEDCFREIPLPRGLNAHQLLARIERIRELWYDVWESIVAGDRGQKTLMDYILTWHDLAYLIGYDNMLPYDKGCIIVALIWYEGEEYFPEINLPRLSRFNEPEYSLPSIKKSPFKTDENVFVLTVDPTREFDEFIW